MLKGLVHQKMKMILWCTHPRGILGVYDFLFSDKSNWSYIRKCPGLSSVTMGISGCLLSTVQKMWNKVRASVIKHASHGSGGWIKASCSESMRFCKKNIHISNVINTFLSLPLTVIRARPSSRWWRTYASHAHLWDMLVSQVCLQEQSFLTLAKENQSPLVLYWNPPKYKSSFCFVLSAFITNHAMLTSYIIRRNAFHIRQSVEVRKSVYVWNINNMNKYIYKYSPPGAVWGMFYYGCACFIWCLEDCWQKAPAYPPL